MLLRYAVLARNILNPTKYAYRCSVLTNIAIQKKVTKKKIWGPSILHILIVLWVVCDKKFEHNFQYIACLGN